MAPESSAVTISHPSPAALKFINPAMRFLLNTPLAGPLRQQMMVLEFTGRKSGRQLSALVSAHPTDGALYAFTNAPWKANFRDNPTVTVAYDGKSTSMQSEFIVEPTVVADLSHRCAVTYGPKRAQRSMGFKFRDQEVPPFNDFLVTIQTNGIIAIKLTPAG